MPWAKPLDIAYEDEALLAVCKPAGLPLYPRFAGEVENLASAVLAHWQSGGGPAVFRPLSRLDKDTSGLVVMAKSAPILQKMQKQTLVKTYLALASGDIASDGVIEAPIGRGEGAKRCVCAQGKYARTRYEVLKRLGDATLLQVGLDTGRTHQIRVHLAYLGHPLLGDALYGGDCQLWPGQALHAWQLKLTHPVSGEALMFTCPFTRLAHYMDIVF